MEEVLGPKPGLVGVVQFELPDVRGAQLLPNRSIFSRKRKYYSKIVSKVPDQDHGLGRTRDQRALPIGIGFFPGLWEWILAQETAQQHSHVHVLRKNGFISAGHFDSS